MTGKQRSSARTEPWKHEISKGVGEHKHLSPRAKASAKRRATAVGRPYPTLVDNMHAAANSATCTKAGSKITEAPNR